MSGEDDDDELGPNYYAYHSRKWVMCQVGDTKDSDDWDHERQSSRSYGDGYGEEDVISIELNGKEKTLRFHKNGSDEGIAFSDVESGTYHLAVSIFGWPKCTTD